MLPTRRIVLALVLCAFLAPAAHAQINLAWNNCITQANAAENKQYACDGSQNGIPFKLVFSFLPPVDLPQFSYVEATIDIGSVSAMPLPDWWRLGVGECRDDNLRVPQSLTGIGTGTTGVCRNPWFGAQTGGGYLYESNHQPSVARLLVVIGRDTPAALTAGQQYVGGVIGLDTFRDVADGVDPLCTGCCQSMLIVLQEVKIYQELSNDILSLTAPATRQHVWWQQVSNCPVPARRTSWGSIKTTYR